MTLQPKRKIIVLTPVKNESWILDRFLKVCSIFADHIIIADQNSTDGSLDMYPCYPKVVLVRNENTEYDEKKRQLLLIETAREKFGTGHILLAIDADEILAGNAMETEDWQLMKEAKEGTVLYFEKPTLYKNTQFAIRYDHGGWPLGYIDDGASHQPSKIHSTRIPTPASAPKLYLEKIKFVHYALVRLDAQASKQRMYSVLENIHKTKSLRLRRRIYSSEMDFSNEGDRHEPAQKEWFENWEKKGVDMHTVPTSRFYWYDYEVLNLFQRYGLKRFLFDDIWNFNWEEFRQYCFENKLSSFPQRKIQGPPVVISRLVKWYFQSLDEVLSKLKNAKKIIDI